MRFKPAAPRLRRRALLFGLLPATFAARLIALPRLVLAKSLTIPYLHQYLGNSSDDYDCGPTCVAMVLEAFGLRPSGLSDAGWVAKVRRTMGVPPYIGTIFDDLQRAFTAYGLQTSLIPSALPGEPDTEIGMMRDALAAGSLVIPLVHGATLGRGDAYGDHWVVLIGFTADGQAHLHDPDDQQPRWSGWVRGGDIMLATALLAQAGLHAQSGPYALVVAPPGTAAAMQQGRTAHITGTDGDGAWLRSTPAVGDNSNKLLALPDGTAVTVIGPLPPPHADGHDWIGVSTADGQQGYIAAEFVGP
jgi:hypothetical protein